MPSKPANLCGAAVGMATAAVQQLGIAPLAEPEVVHRANPNPNPNPDSNPDH